MVKKVTKAVLKKKEKRKLKREFKEKLGLWKQEVIARDKGACQRCYKILNPQQSNPHHIISFNSINRKYPALLTNIKNGVLLCSYCHRLAPYSAHQSGFEFTLWLEKNKPEQYNYLKEFLRFANN